MKTQSVDTRPEAERVLIGLLRKAPIWRRLLLTRNLNRTVRTLNIQGWHWCHTNDPVEHLHHYLANIWLGEPLATQISAARDAAHIPQEGDLMSTDPIALTILVIEQLEALGVPYVLGGALATNAYGIPRSTLDADIVAEMTVAHATPLAQALESAFYVDVESIRDAILHCSSFNVIHLQELFKIDIFIPKPGLFAKSQFLRRTEQVLAVNPERRVFVASPEDSVLAKLDWYRQGGSVSDRQWNDILGVLKVQAPTIDQLYLRQWAAKLGVIDLLDRAFVDAGLTGDSH